MESLYLLIPLSILLVFLIGLLFWWATRAGQFDDLEGPAHRILLDDDSPAQPHNHQPTQRQQPAHQHDGSSQNGDSASDSCSDSSDSGSND